jgi:hypothetical protein
MRVTYKNRELNVMGKWSGEWVDYINERPHYNVTAIELNGRDIQAWLSPQTINEITEIAVNS